MPDSYVACPCCGQWLRLKTNKLLRPWARCEGCAIMIFWGKGWEPKLRDYLDRTEQANFEPEDGSFA